MPYEILSKKHEISDYTYKLGLNVDSNFNYSSFCPYEDTDGLRFKELDQVYIDRNCDPEYDFGIAFITIPADAKVHTSRYFHKADKLIVDKIIPLEDWEMWDNREFCERILSQTGNALRFVKNQTPELCLTAVRQNGDAIRFVKNQTPGLCVEAVKQNISALQHVINQTPELCQMAIHKNDQACHYIRNKAHEPLFKVAKSSC